MSKFAQKISNKTTNFAGGVAYKMGAEQELVHAVLTTFLENKFYESGDDRMTRIVSLVKQNKPEFVAKLAVVARNEFNLRSVSHVLLGELAKNFGGSLVSKTIERCAIRPDDIIEVCAYIGKPLPKQVKKGVRHSLYKFDEYQLAKYKNEGKSWSLVDLVNLCHPNPKHAKAPEALKKLVEGNLKSFDTWEVEVSANATKETWEKLINENKLGYMAMLRNLNNIVKYKVGIDKVVAKITNRDEIKKSKQLPFRFYTAYKNVQGNRKLSDAISEAMDTAVSNTPQFDGKTLIGIDCSGSMSGDPIEKAAIFGATLLKANSGADVILYDDHIEEFSGSGRTPVVDLADRIINDANGGGTNTSLVFAYAIKKGVYDRIIIISDNESWQDSYYGGGTQAAYNAYRNTGADPYVYAIDIQGYGTKDITSDKVFHLCGWSDRLLDFIGQAERGDDLIKYIDSLEL
jgi:hypothetical protein